MARYSINPVSVSFAILFLVFIGAAIGDFVRTSEVPARVFNYVREWHRENVRLNSVFTPSEKHLHVAILIIAAAAWCGAKILWCHYNGLNHLDWFNMGS